MQTQSKIISRLVIHGEAMPIDSAKDFAQYRATVERYIKPPLVAAHQSELMAMYKC